MDEKDLSVDNKINVNQEYIAEGAISLDSLYKDILKYAPSKVCALLGNAIIVPLYTNLLSPSQYGLYSISLAVLSFFCVIFSDWIGLSALRFFRQYQINEKIPKYLSTIVMILGLNLLALYLFAFGFQSLIESYFHISKNLYYIILALIIPVSIRALLFQVLRAQIKPGAFTISTIINQFLTIGLSVVIIKYLHFGAVSILLAMGISISIVDILLIFQSEVFKFFKLEKPNINMTKMVFVYGIPIAIAALSMWVINQSNKFVLDYFQGIENVGLVGAAYSMTFPILTTFWAIISIAAYPRIINIYEDGKDVKPMLSEVLALFLLLSIPFLFVICVYSQDIVFLLSNKSYSGAAVLIPYFAFSAFFMSFTDLTTIQYHLANKTYLLTIIKVASAILGLGLTFAFIKNFGLVGAGYAALVSNVVFFLLSILVSIKGLECRIGVKKFVHLFISIIPCFVCWVFIKNTSVSVIVQMCFLIILYYLSFAGARKAI